MNKIKNILNWMTHTKLGWFLISFIWLAIFTAIDSNIESNWAFWISLPAVVYMVGLTLVMISYAWVINPIRNYRENKKLKDSLKDKK